MATLALFLAGTEPATAVSCTVQAGGLTFDPYDTLSSRPADGVGTIDLSCDTDVTVNVALGSGNGGSGERVLQNGGDSLRYELYTDASRTTPWGDGAGGGAVSATGPTARLNVYGRILPRQRVPAGSYSDAVIVTVIY